jgi:cytochrome c oxidase cbb3-type subunit 3
MRICVAVLACLLLVACQREERSFQAQPRGGETQEKVAQSTNSPGPGGPVTEPANKGAEYEANAYHMSQGKRLYGWFNCSGCHANGGGGSGPALMDDSWIYGSQIENIVATIREGRPNGMPSFRGKIPDDQIWEIAAYIRSLGRYVRKDVAPGRNDSIQAHPAENRLPPVQPQQGGLPSPSELAPD